MAQERGLGLTELARLGFVDLEGTVRKLDELVAVVGDVARSAFADLAQASNPDQALNGLLDLATIDKSKLKTLLKNSFSSARLIRTLGASSVAIDFLRRNPSALSVFNKSESALRTEEQMKSHFVAAAQSLEHFSAENAWSAIRTSYRTEWARLAAFDVTQPDAPASIDVVSSSLADMAAAAIEAGLWVARQELLLTSDYGAYDPQQVHDSRLAVIAMGKCGARELNYISDVDVIFVAETADSARTDVSKALEIATKLATRTMRAMDGNATEPALWQVDPNLRPEGKSGALVRTLESHLAYYERWAENWEFQALLKARFIAGDKALGVAYETETSKLVWSSSTRSGFVESAQKMRERVMEHIPAEEVERQIKLGPGGLRDIEFTVQLLQLVHGREDSSIRVRDTLTAISALRDAGYIARNDAAVFSKNYRILRTLEHRIQLSAMRRTHLMPSAETAQRALARGLGLRSADELLAMWAAVKAEVRALHQKVFYRPLLSAVAKVDGLDSSLSNDQAEDRLRAIGFLDPRSALVHIQALTSGLSRRAAIQKTLLPVLLEWFGEGIEPDVALLAFRRLSEDLGESPWFLRMLRDSAGAAARLARVLSLSRLATNLFEKIPEAAAWLDSVELLTPVGLDDLLVELDSISERSESLEQTASAIRHVRRRETLRIALGAVVGDLRLQDVERGLTDLTEAYLNSFLKLLWNSNQLDIAGLSLDELLEFSIVAMGRFGGGELGFGSDADVMFVYRTLGGSAQEAQKAAERLVSELRRLTSDQVLEFDLDLDLRPEGKNGPIARSMDSYEQYYERWSDSWEAQALLRARPIAGSIALRQDFETLIDRYRYPKHLDQKAVMEIRRIKARVETERLPQGADPKRHLKLGRGSLSDVEWLVQILQLQHGNSHPGIRTPKTLRALEACVEAGLIESHDATVLREAWLLASRVRSAAVLWANKRLDVLPNDRKQLEGIARILEYPPHSATALEQDYLAFTRRSRMVFERLFYAES